MIPHTWPTFLIAIVLPTLALLVLAHVVEYVTRRRWWAEVARWTFVVLGGIAWVVAVLWMISMEV